MFTESGKYIGDGSSVSEKVLFVLDRSDGPLHYEEIFRHVRDIDKDVDLRRVHNAASEVAHLFGRGVFGLERHLPISDLSLANQISRECESLIESDISRQWNSSELIEHCRRKGLEGVDLLNSYSLTIVLKLHGKRLKYLNRNVWVSEDHAPGQQRIDLRQATISILEREGRPLTSAEIRRFIEAERGLSEFFQINPKIPLVRVSQGRWGLLGRDVKISENDVATIKLTLVNILESVGKPVHESEIFMYLSDESRSLFKNIEVVKSLIHESDDVSVNISGYFYLVE